jgi:uroporphyrinogen decarboxylase
MVKKYTSRERINLAINHKEADRVPIDLGSNRSSGISIVAYDKLKNILGIKSGLSKCYDLIQGLAYPEKEIMDLFNVDAIDAGTAFLDSGKDWVQWKYTDKDFCLIPAFIDIEEDKNNGDFYLKDKFGKRLAKKPKTSYFFDQIFWIYKDLEKIPEILNNKDLNQHMWAIPSPPLHLDIFDNNEYKIFIENIKKLYETTDYSVVLDIGGNLLDIGCFTRGTENFFCDILLDKKGTERLLSKLTENYIEFIDRVLKGAGNYIDIIMFSEDLGSQNGPFLPYDVFKKMFKSKYKKMYDYVHQNSNCKTFLHSCGSVYNYIPDLIEIGLDILNPVQTTAANMEPERLKKEFGRDITFWGGGCNYRDILPFKNPEKVKEDVKRRVEILSKNGGFVFNSIHNILPEVPPENIIAMYEAINEYCAN